MTEAQLTPSTPVFRALKVGETWCMAKRLDGDLTSKEDIRTAQTQMRSLVNSAVARAKSHESKPDYATAAFNTRTEDLDLLVGIAVTRIA